MDRKDSKIVSIDYEFKSGLIFKWNFKGYLSPIYFRHIIFIDSDGSFLLSDFIQNFHRKIKLGDMFSFGFVDSYNNLLMTGWKEKNTLTKINHEKLKPTFCKIDQLVDFFSLLHREVEEFQEPVIFSVLSRRSHHQELAKIENYLTQLVQRKNNYIANLFCNARTSVSISTGVNVFNLNDMAYGEGWTFFKSYLSQIALLRVKITIECENGSISSQKKSEWRSVDFNKIERELRMPTVNYLQDIVEFVNQDLKEEINYLLNIRLEYQELSQRSYQAKKSISIRLEKQKTYPKTIASFNQYYQTFDLTSSLTSLKDPYESKTIVWFVKDFPDGYS